VGGLYVRATNKDMDAGTGLTILGSAVGGAKLVEKLLGPTTEYLGEGLKNWTARRMENVSRVFSNASKRLGKKLDEPGAIPPKVLKEVLDGASFCDDELAAEYFGGVLASSRSEVGRDDRGATWSALLSRLSTYQVRFHYLIYRAIYDRFRGQDYRFNMDDRTKLSVLIPFDSFLHSMEFSASEQSQLTAIFNHALFGLNKEDLIETFVYGDQESLKKRIGRGAEPPDGGAVWVTPSALGVELFLWAHGKGEMSADMMLGAEFEFPDDVKPCSVVLNREDITPKKPEQGVAPQPAARSESDLPGSLPPST
jgi:hypothetical protein